MAKSAIPTSALLKCNHTNCSFETRNANGLATHYTQSSTNTNGTRWLCQGEKCTARFCTTQAMDDDVVGHHYTCVEFGIFRINRRYGRKMNAKLEGLSRRTAAQLNGSAPDGPVKGFSKLKGKASNPSKGSTTPKSKAKPRSRKNVESSGEESEEKSEEDSEQDSEFDIKSSATGPHKSNAGPKRRQDLKRKAEDKLADDFEAEEQEDDSDEDFRSKMRSSTSFEPRLTRQSRASTEIATTPNLRSASPPNRHKGTHRTSTKNAKVLTSSSGVSSKRRKVSPHASANESTAPTPCSVSTRKNRNSSPHTTSKTNEEEHAEAGAQQERLRETNEEEHAETGAQQALNEETNAEEDTQAAAQQQLGEENEMDQGYENHGNEAPTGLWYENFWNYRQHDLGDLNWNDYIINHDADDLSTLL